MHQTTRAIVAAAAHAVISGRKVAGLHDHHSGRDLRIAAECRDGRVQAYDGDRSAWLRGTLPELYDEAARAHVSLERVGATARGYDRSSNSFYDARVDDLIVQLFDHAEDRWFAFTVRLA